MWLCVWCEVCGGGKVPPTQKKKMTLGWVVNGGRRHAELQGEMFPRSCGTHVHTNARTNGHTNGRLCMRVSCATHPTPVLFALIHLFCLAHSLLYWGTILFRCAAATCVMLAWTFCCAGFSLIPRLLRISTFLIGTVALTPTVITCTVGLTFQPSLSSSRRSLL